MFNCIVFEDGKIIYNTVYNNILWDGLFSKVKKNGSLINYVVSCLPKNSILIIPRSDGNINRNENDNKYHDVNWKKQIEPFQHYAKQKNKIFIIGTLSQIDIEHDCNYIYLPLDDDIFEYGITYFFNKNTLPLWEERNSELCWVGSCSGIGDNQSLRVKFVDKIYSYNPNTNIRLSTWWSENKNIPKHFFSDRINYNEFTKYKICFIIDGNVIASNHMYGFSIGCIPFVISNSTCWFSHLLKPYINYIPIDYNLNNLIEQIEWVNNNDIKAKQIAENSYQFAETYFSNTYQKEYIKEEINKLIIKEKKIIDCFVFYNELDLLLYRLTILYDIVDKFVLVEANQTYAGNEKELYYQKNKHLFKRFENKIIHIVVNLPHIKPNINYNNNEQWLNEYYQRNSINEGIKKLTLNNNDLIIISDLDEIIDPKTLLILKNNIISENYSLAQDMYYYNLNTFHCNEKWKQGKIVTYEYYINSTPQNIRTSNFSLLEKAGWHFSYFGNKDFIINKIQQFSHQEYNNNLYVNDSIEIKIKNSLDLFNRNYVPIKNLKINENNYLPPLYEKYLLNYDSDSNCNTIKPIYIYFHICCINNWKEIYSRLIFKIKNSGLYNLIKEIRCVILGNDENFINDPKINVIYRSSNIYLYEKKIINLLYNDCINNDCINNDNDFYVLYIHTKGVKHFNHPIYEKNVYDWTEYMCYFNIYNFNLCINELNNSDAIGVNLQSSHDYPLHYSGNFWWSKSSHIRKLNNIAENNYSYNAPEFWVTSINGKYKSLWNSNKHHYNEPYHYSLYENKEIYLLEKS